MNLPAFIDFYYPYYHYYLLVSKVRDMDRYKNLTSKIDEIVNAVKNYNKQASFELKKSTRRLPSIRVSTKNPPKNSRTPDHVDIEFLDKFSHFYDTDRILPLPKNTHKSTKAIPHYPPEIRCQKQPPSSDVELPKLQNLMSLKVHKILQGQSMERSKSTKMISARENPVVLLDKKLRNKTPWGQKLETQGVATVEKPIKKCLSDRKFVSTIIEAKILKKKNRKEKIEEITGWDID